MLEALNNGIVWIMDFVLGWILYLPRDLMLFAVAVLTSAVLTFARVFTTDQNWLKRADDDAKRLKQLARQAKAAGDKAAAKRHKETITLIKTRSMKYELKPLLLAIVPVALLATWAFSRLAYLPPPAGEPVELKVYLPPSAQGQLVSLVPVAGMSVQEGWIQPVVEDKPLEIANGWDYVNDKINGYFRSIGLAAEPPQAGVAVWRLQPQTPAGDYALKVRFDGRTYEKQLLVGSRQYAPPVEIYPDAPVQAVEVVQRPVKLFGYVGGLDFLFLPPWLVAYLLIAIPFVTILKRCCRVY